MPITKSRTPLSTKARASILFEDCGLCTWLKLEIRCGREEEDEEGKDGKDGVLGVCAPVPQGVEASPPPS